MQLGLRYPHVAPLDAVKAAKQASQMWRAASPDKRAGVAAEILARLNAASFEMAHAVQHTTGQPFLMAFQSGGPHAQDRALEAVAYAWTEQRRHPSTALWSKTQRKGDPVTMEKTFTPVGRGIGVLIGCNTFPTWNGYPGLFASLATGNPVVIKPHRRAVLPLAITVRIAREVIAEAGFDPNVVVLAAAAPTERTAPELATHPDVRLVDFTGSTEFGNWLEDNARQAHVYTEKAGINSVLLDSTDDYAGLLRNLAISLSLYSGQMCTAPQNLLIAADGIATDQGTRSPADFAADLAAAVDKLLSDIPRACGTLGAIASEGILKRLEDAASVGRVALASRAVIHPDQPDAVVRTPLITVLDAKDDNEAYAQEWFGPVSFIIVTASKQNSLRVWHQTVREHGALTATVHSTSDDFLEAARSTALDAGVHLSENLTGPVFVNQSAAFSDFHGTAANPAATGALTDPAFVTGRFSILQSRRHVPSEDHNHG
jgi:phenylacetic acid degradation protein paaN